MRKLTIGMWLCGLLAAIAVPVRAQQAMDETYAAKIKEYTTDDRFLNEWVDHLPKSDTVPSPLDYFGDIIGAPGTLHYTHEIYAYLREIANASPRVMVRTIGQSEEGREMIEVIIADEATLRNIDTYRGYLNRLADPRGLSDAEAREIIAKAKPIYYITGGLHSPETGSPEMLMELAYRLAVEESPMIQNIRKNVIFIFTPVVEVDGRDRIVDIYKWRKANRDFGPGLLYWGHYVAHDNNRDGFAMALALTRNMLRTYMHWKATIMHDLHESIPFLYVSTGTGPYNEYIDPITIDEWHNLSHEEVTELTRRGMPGVWTHGFYNGWAANYLIWMANNRNAIGRFYETFGNSIPDTRERKPRKRFTTREWYRPEPPLKKVKWSLRNNTNYMQSGVLAALNYVANHHTRFVENFYIKSKKAVQKGREEAPHAFVIPAKQRRPVATADLINLLRLQGVEVHRAQQTLKWTEKAPQEKEKATNGKSKEKAKTTRQLTAPGGSYVIRLDQPYRTLARILLDKQNFPKDARPPYDDTGWSLPLLRQVQVLKVNDPAILQAKMQLLTEDVKPRGRLEGKGRKFFLVDHTTEDGFAVLRFKLRDVRMFAAEEPFKFGKRSFSAGSYIIPAEGNPGDLADRLKKAAEDLGLVVVGTKKRPNVPTHEIEVPRIALVHTWVATPQDAGWWRYAFDTIGIPYTYLAEQDLATEDLSKFDVIIMPKTWASPQTLVQGTTEAGHPLPWETSDITPNIGKIDQTDDTRRGMGYEGLQNLKNFIKNGGVFITEGSTAEFPIAMAITRRIRIKRTRNLVARGSVFKVKITDKKSPITYGYLDTLAVYFSQSPVFEINKNLGGFRVPDWVKDEIWQNEVPRPVVTFAKKGLLLSGMLKGEKELAGTPAVVDCPVGKGHVVLFANRPFWRWQTHGSHALVFNTILNWNDLRVGWPERPEEEEERRPAAMPHEAIWNAEF